MRCSSINNPGNQETRKPISADIKEQHAKYQADEITVRQTGFNARRNAFTTIAGKNKLLFISCPSCTQRITLLLTNR